ncbi:hypothetical protein JTB14_020287 [Gonioctena quinquepunctata]|nr:hypothetical protein JTB14_020287 [Gonioctena quinquepunctata]
MIIDVNVQHRSIMENSVVYHVPGIIGTLAMVCVNIIPYEILFGTYPYPTDGHCSPLTAKLFLFLSLMTSFGCLIAATYILINDFILSQSRFARRSYF